MKNVISLALVCAAAPALAQADTFPEHVQGTYSTAAQCQFGFTVTIGQSTADLDVAGSVLRIPDWDMCFTCEYGAGGGEGPEVIWAFAKVQEPAAIFKFTPEQDKLVIEPNTNSGLPAELSAFVDAGPLVKCN